MDTMSNRAQDAGFQRKGLALDWTWVEGRVMGEGLKELVESVLILTSRKTTRSRGRLSETKHPTWAWLSLGSAYGRICIGLSVFRFGLKVALLGG